jgi:hypothetical protein
MGRRLSLILVLFFIATACARRGEAPGLGPSRAVGVAFESSPRDAFGEGVYEALESETRARGGRLVDSADAPGSPESPRRRAGLESLLISSRIPGRDEDQILEVLAGGGRDLVIAAGPRFSQAVERVAPRHPGQRFAALGAKADERLVSPNVLYIRFADPEAAFLAGAVAALMVEDGNKSKIGFMGSVESRESDALEAAFRAGAATARSDRRKAATVLSRYCGRALEPDGESVKATRAFLAKQGAAISLECGFGCDSRLLRGSELLARTTRKGDAAASLLLEELFSMGSLAPGYRSLGLAEGAVGIAIEVEEAKERGRLEAAIASMRENIVSGALKVPESDAELADYLALLPAR